VSKFGLFWCFAAGVAFAAFVVGFPIAFSGDGIAGAYIALGINGFWICAVIGYSLLAIPPAAHAQNQIQAGSEMLRTALAKVETSQAYGEAPTLLISMSLTIAPDSLAAFRADAKANVNLMDIDAYKVGRLLIVTYDETRPWRVTVVTTPSPEWSQRAALGAVDSAPLETRVEEPRAAVVERRRWGRHGTFSMLLGTVAGLVLFIATRR
jgi:hypothetical protein